MLALKKNQNKNREKCLYLDFTKYLLPRVSLPKKSDHERENENRCLGVLVECKGEKKKRERENVTSQHTDLLFTLPFQHLYHVPFRKWTIIALHNLSFISARVLVPQLSYKFNKLNLSSKYKKKKKIVTIPEQDYVLLGLNFK